MKASLILFVVLISYGLTHGQTKDEVLAEAYLLYNSEKASWHGTDIFIEQYPEKSHYAAGYISYTEGNQHHCVFYDKQEIPKVLVHISFKDGFNLEEVEVDDTSRKLSAKETDLFILRKLTIEEIGKDDLFQHYNNSNLNPIPLITKNKKQVFVLTGPEVQGVVILGNDYLLTFNKNNKLKSKKALHKNIIPIEYSQEGEKATTIHNHQKSTGHLITSTDLCTIMLYKDYANWEQHIVISEKKVSIYDCETENLLVLSRKAWERLSEN